MRPSMVRAWLAAGTLCLAANLFAQTNVITDPVGFVTLTINGTNTSSFTFLGLSMTQPVVHQSKITAVNGSQVIDSSASWTNGEFSGAGNAHFIELTSDAGAGITEDIVSNTSTSLTTASDLSSKITPDSTTYKVRKHWTIGTVFGSNNEIGFGGGPDATSADNLFILNPLTQQYATYYFKSDGFPTPGWRTAVDPFTDAANTVLYLDQGIWVRRKQPTSVSTQLVGSVKLGQTLIPVASNQNIVANVYAVTNLTLQTCNLYTGNPATGVLGGSDPTTADTVSIWNGTGYNIFYYKTDGFPSPGWRTAVDPFTDVGNTVIPMGSSVRIHSKGHSFDWTVPQPFSYP